MNEPNLYQEYDIVLKQLDKENYVVIKSPEKVEYNINIEQHFLDHLLNFWNLKNFKVKVLTIN